VRASCITLWIAYESCTSRAAPSRDVCDCACRRFDMAGLTRQLPGLQAMCEDYYELDFMDRSIDTSPIAPELARFFDEVRQQCPAPLNIPMGALDHAMLRP
jgi:hypothetical protein